MNFPPIRSFVLCGGSGTRLWPLSRKAYPKQFIPLIGDRSLLELTLQRLMPLGDVGCIGGEEHRFLVDEVAQGLGRGVTQILEPCARNTAPAIAAAVHGGPAEALLLFCPADHYIPDQASFLRMIEGARSLAVDGKIVTFGVVPTFPATGYGYIEEGDELGTDAKVVRGFVEKPNLARAQEMMATGQHLWNAGIFLARADVWADALSRFAPEIWRCTGDAVRNQTIDGRFVRPQAEAFARSPSDSIDYAVMEKASNLAVVRFNGQWSDVGSWNSVAVFGRVGENGNRSTGDAANVHFLSASDTFVHASSRPVVALGTKQLLVIDTPDALLVADASHAENVKQAVALLEKLDAPQAVSHRKVARPWGYYDSVDAGVRHQVKRIMVKPGARLSLQLHHHRAEHWIVVKGTALVTRGEEQVLLTENQSTYIPLGVKHRLENPGKVDLEIIEVQSGDYLGEDDIVRFEDNYGRTSDRG